MDAKKLNGIRVLVVDDNPLNREILSAYLSHAGCNPACVGNGALALDELMVAASKNQPYRLLLLDSDMSELDVLTLAKKVRSIPDIPQPAMVLMGSDDLGIDEEQKHFYGFNATLPKPVMQSKLINTISFLLDSEGAASTLVTQAVTNSKRTLGCILLVEDQPINQEVGRYMLHELGYEVDLASNGHQAVEASAEKNYDAILMDCHMPEMDGFEAVRKIREREARLTYPVRVPVIALTADAQSGIVKQCLTAGMDQYLGKPFNQQQLAQALSPWLPITTHEYVHSNLDESSSLSPEISLQPLDPQALQALRNIRTDNGESLLNQAIKIFLHTAPEIMPNLHAALSAGNAQQLRLIAHGYKSSSANLGAKSLSDSFAAIEKIASQGKTDGIAALLQDLETDLSGSLRALKAVWTQIDQEQVPAAILAPQADISAKHLLLVDDDADFRILARSVLSVSGYSVEEADSAEQALQAISRKIPDLVILDAIMQGIDGFEACRRMRQAESMLDVPIIMATGLDDIDSINLAFAAGANDFITKPINYPILLHRLSFVLRASRDTAELRSSKFQLSSAQRIARLGYWTWDSSSNYFYISEQLAQLCHVDLKRFDFTLDGYIALIHADEQEHIRTLITTAQDLETARQTEYRLLAEGYEPIIVHQEIEVSQGKNHLALTGIVQDITQKKYAELQIERLAYMDELTGLASRTRYHQQVKDYIRRAQRHNEQFAFLFLDLDGFKDINDSFGHDVGDHFLKAIAERLRLVVRNVDFAARLGGDEFCIILDNISSEVVVTEVAERCLLQINQPLLLDRHQIKPRVSIGIAIYPRDGVTEVDLLKAADAAMYAAKQAGKQRFVFYSQDMASQALTRLEREQMLRDAFEHNEFILHYQPKISMQTGRMMGMEALIRWQHPEKGMIPPGVFVPLAEQLGLMVDLGHWVLKAACQQILQWRAEGLPFLHVAVNIAAEHFHDPALFKTVSELLGSTGIPAEYLELEVTESAMQTQGYLEVFTQLRSLGVKIAIDDFGTGYSCLASLKQLPLDCLKVDKVFVDDVLTNPHTSLLLGTIIGLANAFDYTIVAEGVETKEQALVMHGLGCQIVQGYLFSKPVSGDKIPELFAKDFFLDIGHH